MGGTGGSFLATPAVVCVCAYYHTGTRHGGLPQVFLQKVKIQKFGGKPPVPPIASLCYTISYPMLYYILIVCC
jgi:hypothetical protein